MYELQFSIYEPEPHAKAAKFAKWKGSPGKRIVLPKGFGKLSSQPQKTFACFAPFA